MLNTKFIVIFLIVTFVLTIIFTIIQKPEKYSHSRLRVFFNIASVIGSILVAIGLIYTSQVVEDGQKLTKTQQTLNLIERCELNPVRKITEFYPKCPNFVSSLFPQKGLFKNISTNIVDDEASILALSFEMIQAFEDHFTGAVYDLTSETAWAGTFLQWTSSSKFYEIFTLIHPNFTERTVEYTKLLFEYSKKYNIDSSKKLKEAAIGFSNDIRLRNLYHKKTNKHVS